MRRRRAGASTAAAHGFGLGAPLERLEQVRPEALRAQRDPGHAALEQPAALAAVIVSGLHSTVTLPAAGQRRQQAGQQAVVEQRRRARRRRRSWLRGLIAAAPQLRDQRVDVGGVRGSLPVTVTKSQ